MELKISGTDELRTVEMVQTGGESTLTIRVNGMAHIIRLLKITGSEIEFIMDNKYHSAKVIQSETLESRLLIDDQPVVIKRHPKIIEMLKKSLSGAEKGEGGDKDIKSQIPGRVVNIVIQVGSPVKRGDPIVVLESMKMQVAVKAHKDGNIKQIKVNQGSTVGRYDVVAVLD